MVSLATPSPLDRILSEHVKNLSNLILGASGYGQRVQFTQYSDSTNYANTFGNTDTTNGRAVKIQYGDPAGSPVTLATFQKSGSRIQSNDGTEYLDVSNSGVAVTGTFTVNGQSVGSGFTVYNVRDHGVTAGTGTTYAGANTTALQTLWTTTATAGGGIIYFPPGDYSFNATTLDHAQGTGATKAITLKGAGGSSILKFYGASGPYLTIASTATSPLAQCGIEDLYINHGQLPSSGATIRLGYVTLYHMDNVHLYGSEAFIALQFITSGNAHLRNCTFSVQNASGAVAVDCAQTVATGGVQITSCNLSGPTNSGSNVCRGLRFQNSALLDTVILNGANIMDHDIGISSYTASGGVANFQMNGGVMDRNNYDVSIAPLGGNWGAWDFSDVWMYAYLINILLSCDNMTISVSDSVGSFTFNGGRMTGATNGGIGIYGGVTDVKVIGVAIGGTGITGASEAVVELSTMDGASPSNISVIGCTISAGATAEACIKTVAAATPILFANNILRGSADADGIVDAGATSAARVITGNAYAA